MQFEKSVIFAYKWEGANNNSIGFVDFIGFCGLHLWMDPRRVPRLEKGAITIIVFGEL